MDYPNGPYPQFIVAEVSKNWRYGIANSPGLLSENFETVIEINHRRGYRLQSFQIHRLLTGLQEMNETLIAVFELIVFEKK